MMSSSMARTASVSISSYGKKRLLSLFSLVRTTLRGTLIFGQSDSAKEAITASFQRNNKKKITISTSFGG